MNWDDVREALGADVCEDDAVLSYQGTQNNRFYDAEHLNTALNLEHFGLGSKFSKLYNADYGASRTLDDFDDFPESKEAMESAFQSFSVAWNGQNGIFLYKGIDEYHPYYRIHNFANKKIGDTFTMPGYFSASLSLDVAKQFAKPRGSNKVVLRMVNMSNTRCVFPPNKPISFGSAQGLSEQEVLFDKGITFKVVKVDNTDSEFIFIDVEPV